MLSVQNNLYVGNNAATGMGQATSTFQGDIKINGKLDVGTIDPPYTIGETKYATFVPSMTGVKEETTMTVQLTDRNEVTGKYETVINFDELEKDSDLWLFYQITDFGDNWKNLVVQVTPSFDGQVFYKKDIENNTLTISGTESGEVSLRLSGNRFDHTKWPNLRADQDGKTEGTHVLPEKAKSGQAAKSAKTASAQSAAAGASFVATNALEQLTLAATSTFAGFVIMATSTWHMLLALLHLA
jgi:FlaG/FlaF family flagellin (archaellin)